MTQAALPARPAAAGKAIVTTDRFVPHVSTVPANAGQSVGLHLREKSLAVPGRRPVVLFAPTPFLAADDPHAMMPEPGAPVVLQPKATLLKQRWAGDVRRDGQVDDPAVPEIMWRELMREDPVGAQWRPEGIMRAPSRMNFGWRSNAAAIRAPTLAMVGEFDNYRQRRDAWTALRARNRVFIKVACSSHFMQYERGRRLLHRATREWLETGAIDGSTRGELQADEEGRLTKIK